MVHFIAYCCSVGIQSFEPLQWLQYATCATFVFLPSYLRIHAPPAFIFGCVFIFKRQKYLASLHLKLQAAAGPERIWPPLMKESFLFTIFPSK